MNLYEAYREVGFTNEEILEVTIPGEETWVGALASSVLGLGVGLPVYKLYKAYRRDKTMRQIERKIGRKNTMKFLAVVQAYAKAKEDGDDEAVQQYGELINRVIDQTK